MKKSVWNIIHPFILSEGIWNESRSLLRYRLFYKNHTLCHIYIHPACVLYYIRVYSMCIKLFKRSRECGTVDGLQMGQNGIDAMQYTDISSQRWYIYYGRLGRKTFPQYESCANSIWIECIAFYVHFCCVQMVVHCTHSETNFKSTVVQIV